jgi:hypothetical protein
MSKFTSDKITKSMITANHALKINPWSNRCLSPIFSSHKNAILPWDSLSVSNQPNLNKVKYRNQIYQIINSMIIHYNSKSIPWKINCYQDLESSSYKNKSSKNKWNIESWYALAADKEIVTANSGWKLKWEPSWMRSTN